MPRALMMEEPTAHSALETDTLRHRNLEVDRRIEDWLVCYLDDTEAANASASFVGMLESGSIAKKPSWTLGRPAAPKARNRLGLTHDWVRIDIRRTGSVVVVRLLDRMLIKEGVISELSEELADLLNAGNRRIVLNFGNVERMSSTIVAVLMKAHRCCAEAPGGMLKICGLSGNVADVFAVAGLPRVVPILEDEAAALADPWPARPIRPLPFPILSAIAGPGGRATDEAEGELGAMDHNESAAAAWPGEGPPSFADDEPGRASVWLVVDRGEPGGPKRGDVIAVSSGLFLIGRGPECHLRLKGSLISGVHALIERQDNFVYFRDAASGGALINSRAPGGFRSRLKNGDRIQLGGICLSVVIGADLGGHRRIEELVASWLVEWNERLADPVEASAATEIYTLGEGSSDELVTKIVRGPLCLEVIQNVLVVTPRLSRLDEEKAVEQLREALAELFELSLPRRVVLKLDHVTHISSRALGVLLAYFLRLSRDGGALRISNLHARVFSLIEQLRLPVLLELCSTVEEAVITSWD
jgi:anti-anti-sigma factor